MFIGVSMFNPLKMAGDLKNVEKILKPALEEFMKDSGFIKKAELEKLEKQYAKMIYYAHKNKHSFDNWVFIFSSKSFNQAYKRLKYFKQYAQHRKIQAEIITSTKQELSEEVLSLENQKTNLRLLLKLMWEKEI